METTWSLEKLYHSFDSKEFIEDMEAAKKQIESYTQWMVENLVSRDNEKEKIEKAIQMRLDMEKYEMLPAFAELSLSVDSEDKQAVKATDKTSELISSFTKPQVIFEKYVMGCEKLEEYIKSSALLKEHEYYLTEIKENGKYLLSEEEEELISKMSITGSQAWSQMKDQLVGSILTEIEVDGQVQKLTLPMLRNLAYSSDQDVRKRAYEAELCFYKGVEKPVAAALNAVKGEAITISRLRGYESALDMTLKSSRMDRQTLDAMMEAIEEYLPVFHTYFKKKAAMLGHKGSLPWYDLFAPVGSVELKYTKEEAADFIVKNFNDFSEELGAFARNAFDNRWIDLLPKQGKVGGAFCAGLHYIKESRILANFSGSLDGLITLAHELGHGFHGHCLNEESALNSEYPMPIAETASTFCETMVTRAALKTASEQEATVIRENEISGCAQVIVDIYSRFIFEKELFARREEGSLMAEEINELMLASQKKAYGDGLDHEYLNSGMWICKSHYYSAGLNYYNFPYAYGQLFALGLYGIYLKEGASFVEKYKKMLRETGKNDLASVAAMMGIDVRDKAFWASSLEVMKQEIDEL
ncbi:M3 family oligoendopeptidase [Lachnospiraceae bacterium OttesenSCG-928-D06]|nr:M3 family oligoendopeptidase [Lachnospiraceae bacterium OttesenSCG-928-D06]